MEKKAVEERVKKNGDYWKARFELMENEQYQRSAAYYKDVQKQFAWASNDIQMDIARWYQRLADNNGISYAEARKFLKESEREEFQWSVERYIKAGKENAVTQRWMRELENASARHHISYLEAMKLQIQQHAELLSTEFEGGITDFLHKSYGEQYYHTAFELAKGTGTGSNLVKLDDRKIDALIRRPWARDGANFSDRIWTNKEKLVSSLHTELSQNIIRGSSPRAAINNLAKTMEVSKGQAGRLIMTESAAISSAAQRDCLEALGVEQYAILATLDSHTSKICQSLDGKVFDMKDYIVGETAPPFHPWCRSTTIPYFDDEFSAVEERAARDLETGKTVYVDGNLKYPEWKEKYVKKTIDVPDELKIPENAPEKTKVTFEKELSLIPKEHRDIIDVEVKELIVDLKGNSRYDRTKGILYLSENLDEGEAIHEMAHVIETSLGLYRNVEFIDILQDGLGDSGLSQIEYVPDEYSKTVFFIHNPKFVSEYQGRLYDEVGFFDDNDRLNPNSLAEYFSEGYREYILNPEKLKERDKRLFDYIERMEKR